MATLPVSMVYAGSGLILVLFGFVLVPVALLVHAFRHQYLADSIRIALSSSFLLFAFWFVFDGPFSGWRWWSLPIVPYGGAMACVISLIAAVPVMIVAYLARFREDA
jgi:hypothetical protein